MLRLLSLAIRMVSLLILLIGPPCAVSSDATPKEFSFLIKIYDEHDPKKPLRYQLHVPRGHYLSQYAGTDLPIWTRTQQPTLQGSVGLLTTIRVHSPTPENSESLTAELALKEQVSPQILRVVWQGRITYSPTTHQITTTTQQDNNTHYEVHFKINQEEPSILIEVTNR